MNSYSVLLKQHMNHIMKLEVKKLSLIAVNSLIVVTVNMMV
jgi:hypothetical protein